MKSKLLPEFLIEIWLKGRLSDFSPSGFATPNAHAVFVHEYCQWGLPGFWLDGTGRFGGRGSSGHPPKFWGVDLELSSSIADKVGLPNPPN